MFSEDFVPPPTSRPPAMKVNEKTGIKYKTPSLVLPPALLLSGPAGLRGGGLVVVVGGGGERLCDS